jgi:hypothetical protein
MPSIAQISASGAVTVIGAHYCPDHPFPEYECFWHDGGYNDGPDSSYPNTCGPSSPMGAAVHVFLKNNNPTSVTVTDTQLAGVSLNQALTLLDQGLAVKLASVYLARASNLITAPQLQTLLNAGEPVWYKFAPATIPPGGTAQVAVRLRRPPTTQSINLNVVYSVGSTNVAVTVPTNPPALASVSFSADLTKAYLYWRGAQPGQAPVQVLMDGVDVTANTTTSADAAVSLSPSILQLNPPLANGTFHVFQGVLSDGQKTTAGVRAWSNEIIYGMWGAMPGSATDTNLARAYLQNLAAHLINTEVQTLGSQAVQNYLKTADGQQYAAALGLGFIIDAPNKWGVANPRLFFIKDEPDSQLDPNVAGLGDTNRVGATGQGCLQYASTYLGAGDATAVLDILNVDNYYKPYNFCNYGQLPDVLSVDPYYQVRLRRAYWEAPIRIPLYAKATYVYAMAQAGQAACEPNPLHIVLYAVSYIGTSTTFPFPTPECKRIEVYYALAAGAKGLSYWYFNPGNPSNGLGDGSAGALALWREIALLGAEVRTAGPILATSCPATLTIQNSAGLWVRPLLSGRDTMMLLVVNDDYSNDAVSCHYTNVNNATVTATLPSWMQSSPTAFEISAGGVGDVSTVLNGNQFQVNLGTVKLTRMIVLTTNPQLRATVQQRYDLQFRSAVCAIAPELCLPAQPTLGYARQGSALAFSWPTNSVGFALEYATNVPAANWVSASPAPVVVGGQYVVTNTITNGDRFYRLRK